jgi:hypothetical protein
MQRSSLIGTTDKTSTLREMPEHNDAPQARPLQLTFVESLPLFAHKRVGQQLAFARSAQAFVNESR